MFLKVRKKQRSIYFLCYIIIGLSELIAKFSHQTGKLQFLVLPSLCPPVPSIELPSFFALVMPLNMPSTDILKCPLYILPFFNGMPSLGMLHFQMC